MSASDDNRVAINKILADLFSIEAGMESRRELLAGGVESGALRSTNESISVGIDSLNINQQKLSVAARDLSFDRKTFDQSLDTINTDPAGRLKLDRWADRHADQRFGDVLKEVSDVLADYKLQVAASAFAREGPGALCVIGGALAIAGALTANPKAVVVGGLIVLAEC